jgi:hypothetical protein
MDDVCTHADKHKKTSGLAGGLKETLRTDQCCHWTIQKRCSMLCHFAAQSGQAHHPEAEHRQSGTAIGNPHIIELECIIATCEYRFIE